MKYTGTDLYISTKLRYETASKIESFGNLLHGWHYGSGGPINHAVIQAAKKLLTILVASGFTFNDAFPGPGGEIQLTAYHADQFISIIIESDLSASFAHEQANVAIAVPVEGENLQSIEAKIKSAAGKIWNLSDMSTRSFSIKGATAFPSWGLRNHQQTVEHPSSATVA
jgi:hypothetical protein